MLASKLDNFTEKQFQNNIGREKGRHQSRVTQKKAREKDVVRNMSTLVLLSTNASCNVMNCRPSSIMAFFNAFLFLYLRDIVVVVVMVKQ